MEEGSSITTPVRGAFPVCEGLPSGKSFVPVKQQGSSHTARGKSALETNSEGTHATEGEAPSLTRILPMAPERSSGHHDEPGTELDPEARVWKVYVNESNRFDTELVEEWRRSLDVTTMSGALFSVVCTIFTVDSLQYLQPDTTEIIAQTLRTLANPQNSGVEPQPLLDFQPSWSAVWMNALCYLSLSLSVAVSLTSMLAKEWCNQFLSGRTGQACAQARRRQRSWNGVLRWRMPEVIKLLPYMLHLVPLIFAVGLLIRLWDTNSRAAIPGVLVTSCIYVVYVVSIVLPLGFEDCPYRTSLSHHALMRFTESTQPNEDENTKQDNVTSEALSWIIETVKESKSVDIALQAIAGADKDLPLEPLIRCNAAALVRHRMTTGSSELQNLADYELILKLYARALVVLQPSAVQGVRQTESYHDVVELKKKIKVLQAVTERNLSNWLAAEDFLLTQENLLALRTGNSVSSRCLHSLSYMRQDEINQALGSAFGVLGKYAHNPTLLQPAAIRSLVINTTTLLSCSYVHSNSAVIAPYVVRLLRANLNPRTLSILLATLAVLQEDYPGWICPAPLSPAKRTERAVEIVTFYVSELDALPQTLTTLGLLNLLLRSDEYGLNDEDLDNLISSFPRAQNSSQGDPIHTFPNQFNPHKHVLDSISSKLLNKTNYDALVANSLQNKSYLTALWYIDSQLIGTPPPEVYAFVIESICRTPSGIVRSNGLDLMQRYPPFQLSHSLALLIDNRNILPLLTSMLTLEDDPLCHLAAAQMCLIIESVLQGEQTPSDITALLLVDLVQCKELWRTPSPPKFPVSVNNALLNLRQHVSKGGNTHSSKTPHDLEVDFPMATLVPGTYGIVVRSICQPPSVAAGPVYGLLFSKVPTPLLSNEQADLIDRQSLIPLLVKTLKSAGGKLHDFTVSQLCFLIQLVLDGTSCSAKDFHPLLVSLAQCDELWHLKEVPPVLYEALLNLRRLVMNLASNRLPGYGEPSWEYAETTLRVLHRTYNQSTGPPTPQVYVLVAEQICQSSKEASRSFGGELMSRFPVPELSNELASLIGDRNLIATLTGALCSDDQDVRTYATKQLCLFLEIALQSSREPGGASERLAVDLIQCRELCNPGPSLEWQAPLAAVLAGFRLYVITSIVDRSANHFHIISPEHHLDALCRVYHSSIGAPTPQAHVFLLENVLRDPSATMKRLAGKLFCRFPSPVVSDKLVTLIVEQNIVPQLIEGLHSTDHELRMLLSAHLYLLIKLVLDSPEEPRASLRGLFSNLWGYQELFDPLQRLASVKEALKEQLFEMCGAPFDSETSYYIHLYARRIVMYERSQ